MRLAENESRRVGMKFEALVELSRKAEGINVSKACFGVLPVIYYGFFLHNFILKKIKETGCKWHIFSVEFISAFFFCCISGDDQRVYL